MLFRSLVGIFLNVESSIAEGHFPPKMLSKVKDTTAYTLSAIGDSVFAGSLLIFWVMLTICLLLSGQTTSSFVIGICFLAGLQAFRVYTFTGGIRQGFRFLEKLKQLDLINWGRRVKYANAVLLIWPWSLIWPRPYQWWEWPAGATSLILFGQFGRASCRERVSSLV